MAIIINTRTWQDLCDIDDDRAQDICDQKNLEDASANWVVDRF